MADNIVQFRPQQSQLEEAWAAYDAARLRVEAIYRDEGSTADQRRCAVIEADRLHRTFRRLSERAETVHG